MKFKEIKAQLIEYLGYDKNPITKDQKELIKDINCIVKDHYKTKLDTQAELYHESLDEKNRQLMELTVFNDGLEKQRRLDEATINGLRKEIVDKEESWGKTVGNFYEEILFNKQMARSFSLMYRNLQSELMGKDKLFQQSIETLQSRLNHEIERGKLIQSFFDKNNPIHKL